MTGRAQRAGRPEADAPGALLERIARATVAAWGLDKPDTVAFIASIDGHDAAVAMVNAIDRMGYVGWVGTLPAFRRRGFGEPVSRAATNAAFEHGADIVALEASSMALPLYSKLGYETVGIDRVWLPPSD